MLFLTMANPQAEPAQRRTGPHLPSPLKELFLPSGTNESPLSIYGQFLTGYTQFEGVSGQFEIPDFSPYFLLTLNDQFLLAASIDINASGAVACGEAQANWLATDWLTVVGGRYITPIGFFNERINHEWINKLPDVPLMFRQVSPLISTDGAEARGSFYLFGSPVKMEYSVYGGNGFELPNTPTGLADIANLEVVDGASLATNGGGTRIGLWIPAWAVTCGISSYFNGHYAPGAQDDMQLWQVDAGYRKGNWDLRFEYCDNFQQATSFIGHDIRRRGMYTQVAYRAMDQECKIIRNTEFVYR
jgi:hypothetical protein